nr:Dihydrofolate reductase [uncultured bacterium]
MIKSIIVAESINHVIGNQGKLPWHMPADMKHFRNITMGHHVIMGRKTFESIPHGLPGRKVIVLSQQAGYRAENAIVVSNWKAAFEVAQQVQETEVLIAGGATIYQEALEWVDKIYLTRIEAEITGDAFFPELNERNWRTISSMYHPPDAQHAYGYDFVELKRRVSLA